MAIGENDYDDSFRASFGDDPVAFHHQKLELFSVIVYSDIHMLVVFVNEKVKPLISKTVGSVIACNKTLHDDMVEPDELLNTKREFSNYNNLFKTLAVICEDDLIDIVQASRDPEQTWDTIYENLENAVLMYSRLKNDLMSDVEHCYFLNRPPNQSIWHSRKAKMKVYKNLHTEELHLLKQSDQIHRCSQFQGMQAVLDGLDILQMKQITSSSEELINHSDQVYRSFLRQGSQPCGDGFNDLQETYSETLLTPNICKAAAVVSCAVAEDVRTDSVQEKGVCFGWRSHRLNDKTMAVVMVLWCLLCTPVCRGTNVDSKADHLYPLFIWDGIKDVNIEDGRYLVITLKEPSLEFFYQHLTGIGFYICRHEHRNLVDASKITFVVCKGNNTHAFEEYFDFVIHLLQIKQESRISRLLNCKTDVWLWTKKCRTMCSLAQCQLQDEINDLLIENGLYLVFTLEEPSLKDLYKQWTGLFYYIYRHTQQNLVDSHKEFVVFLKGNENLTFEEDCDFGICFLHIEQESDMSSLLDGKKYFWLCTIKCKTLCSPAQCFLQGFQQVLEEIMQACSQNQRVLKIKVLEMTNSTVKVISLKPNNDEWTTDTEAKMSTSSDVLNTYLTLCLAVTVIFALTKVYFLCAGIFIKMKYPNPITWILCKKYSPTTYDLDWLCGNSKLSEFPRYIHLQVHREVPSLRKPVQEQNRTPETKPTVSNDTACSEKPENYYSLTEKYITPLLKIDGSLEESSEIFIATKSIEADPNTEFVYDEHCEIDIRKFTENKGIRNELQTQDEQTSNFHANKELVKSKSIPKVVDASNDLSSARKDGGETFYDLKWKRNLPLKVNPEIPLEKSFHLQVTTVIIEDAVSPTAKFVDDVDFDKLSADKENPRRRRKGVDNTFSEKEFDRIRLLRDLTWLPLNQLPVPKVDIIVGFVPYFPPLMAIIDLIAIGKPPAPHISMRYELLRFCTLRSYPRDDKPYLIKLAEAGFYYASDGDGVVCYCCGIRRYNWTADDNPMKIHKRINPTCKFLTKNEEVNVRNEFNGPFSKSLLYIDNILEPRESQEPSEDINNDWAPERIRSPAPRPQSSQNAQSSSQLGINTAIPKHSQYATKPARIASFNGWPDSASHSPDELADAGFFYAGFGDCVRCFYCGIGLRHWTQDDNPWIEHARWAKNCVFVKQKKGDEFVNLVQLAVQYSQDTASQENATANQLSPREIENYLLSDASQSVLEMGYQPRIIKKAIENILRQNRQAEITAQFLMEQVLALEEAGNSTQAAPTPGSPVAPVAHVGPTEGALASAPKESANEKRHDKESKNITHTPVAEEKKKEEKKTSKETKDKKTGSNDPSAQDPKAIKAENEQLKEQTLCKICLDQTVCIVFLPCGHLVACADCAPAMRKCPICRALVKGTVRTYMS